MLDVNNRLPSLPVSRSQGAKLKALQRRREAPPAQRRVRNYNIKDAPDGQ